MQFPRKVRRSPVINIINLIDVLVVLLIFYIATTVFKRTEPKLNIVIPPSTTAKTTQENIPSTIYVTSDSKLYFDDTPVDVDKLGDLLQSKLTANPNFKVATKIDKTAPWEIIVKVMDACNQAHIPTISAYTATKAAGAAK